MLLSFVIVNYRSRDYLLRCIRSIHQKNFDFPYEIIIVNNDPLPLDISSERDACIVVEENENPGFAISCNIGARAARGTIICFLNPDTELQSDQDIWPLLDLLIQERFSIIGPKLIPDFSSSTPQEWSAGVQTGILDIIKNNLGLAASKKIWQNKNLIDADWVSGASLFVRRDDFFEIQGFDENFFMYFEDMDLCTRMRTNGKKIAYFPEYSVIHFSGKSSASRSLQKKQYLRSQHYFLTKHSGKLSRLLMSLIKNIS